MEKFRKRIFDIIQIGNKEDVPSRAFDIFLVGAIVCNIAVMFLETFDCMMPYASLFRIVEIVTICIFCIEYILRIWTADFLFASESKLKARIHFLYSFDGIVELLTILPFFYLSGFVAFRLLRVVRIFHLFRLNAQYDSFNIIAGVIFEKRNQIVSSLFIIMILMLASSIGMYSVEHTAQPEVFTNAFSGIWWAAAALLTVGYGDIYPVTIVGQIMGIVIAFLGVGVVAIPTGIISAGFVEHYTEKQNENTVLHDVSQIGEIVVHEGHQFVDHTIAQIGDVYKTKVYMVMRNGLAIVATADLTVQEGDLLIVHSRHVVKGND